MTRTVRMKMVAVVIVVGVILAMASGAMAGDNHFGTTLNCANCHVMHGSYNGTLYNSGNGFANLLKGTATETCLSCHQTSSRALVASGTAGAPNDILTVAYPSPYKNSAGYFQSDWKTAASPVGHDLGPSQVTAIQGTWHSGSAGMQCTDCHDAHGTPNFRNLTLTPGDVLGPVNIREGTEVELQPLTDSTLSSWAKVADTAVVAFNDPNNFVQWCIGCHTSINTGEKHPQDKSIAGGNSDGTHWYGGTGTGFGTAIGDSTPGIPRVRFAQAGTDYATCTTVSASTNKVFCLSCHKAHGSKYDSSLVWPHYVDGAADQTSACGQCHNQGG